jgi:hypothetical protein
MKSASVRCRGGLSLLVFFEKSFFDLMQQPGLLQMEVTHKNPTSPRMLVSREPRGDRGVRFT